MSGHSKWATTKHQKAVVDARRAKSFAKLIKNIEVAARLGGGDLDGNPTLYDAVQKARKTSVPKDNIERAIKRGSGAEGGGAAYEALFYEAYGPAGIAMLIECLTDNRNRSASDVRVAVTRNGTEPALRLARVGGRAPRTVAGHQTTMFTSLGARTMTLRTVASVSSRCTAGEPMAAASRSSSLMSAGTCSR